MTISIYAYRFTQIAAPPGATISILNLVCLTFFAITAAKLPTTTAMADPPARKRPSTYQQFDPATKKLRQALIESLATSLQDHLKLNDGKRRCVCQRQPHHRLL